MQRTIALHAPKEMKCEEEEKKLGHEEENSPKQEDDKRKNRSEGRNQRMIANACLHSGVHTVHLDTGRYSLSYEKKKGLETNIQFQGHSRPKLLLPWSFESKRRGEEKNGETKEAEKDKRIGKHIAEMLCHRSLREPREVKVKKCKSCSPEKGCYSWGCSRLHKKGANRQDDELRAPREKTFSSLPYLMGGEEENRNLFPGGEKRNGEEEEEQKEMKNGTTWSKDGNHQLPSLKLSKESEIFSRNEEEKEAVGKTGPSMRDNDCDKRRKDEANRQSQANRDSDREEGEEGDEKVKEEEEEKEQDRKDSDLKKRYKKTCKKTQQSIQPASVQASSLQGCFSPPSLRPFFTSAYSYGYVSPSTFSSLSPSPSSPPVSHLLSLASSSISSSPSPASSSSSSSPPASPLSSSTPLPQQPISCPMRRSSSSPSFFFPSPSSSFSISSSSSASFSTPHCLRENEIDQAKKISPFSSSRLSPSWGEFVETVTAHVLTRRRQEQLDQQYGTPAGSSGNSGSCFSSSKSISPSSSSSSPPLSPSSSSSSSSSPSSLLQEMTTSSPFHSPASFFSSPPTSSSSSPFFCLDPPHSNFSSCSSWACHLPSSSASSPLLSPCCSCCPSPHATSLQNREEASVSSCLSSSSSPSFSSPQGNSTTTSSRQTLVSLSHQDPSTTYEGEKRRKKEERNLAKTARDKRKPKVTLAHVISSFIRSALSISEDEGAPANRNEEEEEEEEEQQEGEGGQGNEENENDKKKMIKEIEGPCPEGVQHLSTSQTHHISSLSPNERKKDEEGEEREGDGMTEKKTSFRWADEKCIDEEEEEEDNPSVYFNEMEGHNKRSISNFCFSSSSSYPSYSPSDLRGGCSSPPVSSLSSSSFSSSRDFMAHRCHSPSTQHPAIPSSPSPLSSPGASYHCSSEKNQVPKRSPGKADEGGKSRRPRRRRKKTSIPASTMPTSSYPPSLNKDTSSSPSCSSSSFAGQTVYDTHRHPNLERDICLSSTFPSDFLPCSSSSSISSFDLPSASPPASHESIRCSSSSPRMPVLQISPPSPPSASSSSSLLPNSDQSSFPSYPYFYWFLPSYLPCHQITCESTIPSSVTQFSPIHPLFFSSSCAPLLTPSGSFSSPGSSYSPPLLSSCLLSTSFASPSLDVSSLLAPPPYPNDMQPNLSSSPTPSLPAALPPVISSPPSVPSLSTFSSSLSPYPIETRFLPSSTRANHVSSSSIQPSEISPLDDKSSFFTPTTTTTTAPDMTPVHSEEASPCCSPLPFSFQTYHHEETILSYSSSSSSLPSKLSSCPSSYPTSTLVKGEPLHPDRGQRKALPSLESHLFTVDNNVIPRRRRRRRSCLPPSTSKEHLGCDTSSAASLLPARINQPRPPKQARGNPSTHSVSRGEWRKKERHRGERSLSTVGSYHCERREEEEDEDTKEPYTGGKETRDLRGQKLLDPVKSGTKGEGERGKKDREEDEKRDMMRERRRNETTQKNKMIMRLLSTGERGGDQEEEEESLVEEGKSCFFDRKYAETGEREKRREDISEIVEKLEKTEREKQLRESLRRETKRGKEEEEDERVEEEETEEGERRKGKEKEEECEGLLHLHEQSSLDALPSHSKSEVVKEEEETCTRREDIESLVKKRSLFERKEEEVEEKKKTGKMREKQLSPPFKEEQEEYQRPHRGTIPLLRAVAYKEDKEEEEGRRESQPLEGEVRRDDAAWGEAFQGDAEQRTRGALRLPPDHYHCDSSLDLDQLEEKKDRETRRRRERRGRRTPAGRQPEEENEEDLNERRRRKRASALRSFTRKEKEMEEEKDACIAFHTGELRFLQRTVVQALASVLKSPGGRKERKSRARFYIEDAMGEEEQKCLKNTERLTKERTRGYEGMEKQREDTQREDKEEEERERGKEKKIHAGDNERMENEMHSKTGETRDHASSSSSFTFEKKKMTRRREERRCTHNSSSSPPLSSPFEDMKKDMKTTTLLNPLILQKQDGGEEEAGIGGDVKGDEELCRGKGYSSSSYVSPPPLREMNGNDDSTCSYPFHSSSPASSSSSPSSSLYPTSPSSSSSSRPRNGSLSPDSCFPYHHDPSSSSLLSPSLFSLSSSCSSPPCPTSPYTTPPLSASPSSSSLPFERAEQRHHEAGNPPLYFSSYFPLQDLLLPFQSPPQPFSSSSSSFFISPSSSSYAGLSPSLPSSCPSDQAPYPSVFCMSPSLLSPLPSSPSLSNLHLWIESCKAFLTPDTLTALCRHQQPYAD